jgi:uridine phosphorylase
MRAFGSTNFPLDAEQRTYHVECGPKDIANRIITVGDRLRALRIAKHLDIIEIQRESKRGFLFITGMYHGVRVSIISIGMGFPLADMMLREVRAVTFGELLVLRFGSCGSIGDVPAGAIAVSNKGGCMVTKNYDYWNQDGSELEPYLISKLIPADFELSNNVF